MSVKRNTTKRMKESSELRRLKIGTRNQKMKELAQIKSQEIAEDVAQQVRQEIVQAVKDELDSRGYPAKVEPGDSDGRPTTLRLVQDPGAETYLEANAPVAEEESDRDPEVTGCPECGSVLSYRLALDGSRYSCNCGYTE